MAGRPRRASSGQGVGQSMSALPPISSVNLLWNCQSIIHFNADGKK
jgi:hypothetical protein